MAPARRTRRQSSRGADAGSCPEAPRAGARARRRCRACSSRGARSSRSPCSSSRRRLPVLRAAEPRRRRQDRPPHRGRRQAGGSPPAWCFEVLSFAGYVVLFRCGVRARRAGASASAGGRATRSRWPASLATRLFAAAGAGGVALTAWALRRSGMEPRLVASRMVAFMVLLYVIYAGSLLIDGIGLGIGLFPGGGSFAITIVPAIVAAVLFAAAGAMALLPGDLERRLQRWASGSGRARALGRARRDRAGARGQRRAHRDRADPQRATPGCSARSRGGALTSPCCGRCSTRSARRRRSP